MADMNVTDFSVAKLTASVVGAFVSLKFVQGTASERSLMFVGGAAVSYYSTTPLAQWIGVPNIEGLIGFFTGLLGMAIVSKAYEMVQAVDAKALTKSLQEWAARKWGA